MTVSATGASETVPKTRFSELTKMPDARGHFGPYGGRFVSETLSFALEELEKTYLSLRDDPDFQAKFDRDLAHFVGRPSPLYHAERWSQALGGAQIWLKREDLNHTGAHKVNNTIGQALLAKNGQTKSHCGNRRWAARRCNRYCCGTPGP